MADDSNFGLSAIGQIAVNVHDIDRARCVLSRQTGNEVPVQRAAESGFL